MTPEVEQLPRIDEAVGSKASVFFFLRNFPNFVYLFKNQLFLPLIFSIF